MKISGRNLGLTLLAVALLSLAPMRAQEAQQKPQAASGQAQEQNAEQPKHVTDPNRAAGRELTEATKAAEGEPAEKGENEGLKHSVMVRKMAKILGISVEAAYWIGMLFNFAIIFAFIAWAMKKNLPGVFRARNEAIQRGISEARAASEDAKRRLSDIEARLLKLDADVVDIRTGAEKESAAEEVRIRETAEAEVKRILEAGEQEIEAAGRQARRDLKSLAAGLAVDLAARKLQIDEHTDESLVRGFVAQLGKDGK